MSLEVWSSFLKLFVALRWGQHNGWRKKYLWPQTKMYKICMILLTSYVHKWAAQSLPPDPHPSRRALGPGPYTRSGRIAASLSVALQALFLISIWNLDPAAAWLRRLERIARAAAVRHVTGTRVQRPKIIKLTPGPGPADVTKKGLEHPLAARAIMILSCQ
jgi:hypothetical protein